VGQFKKGNKIGGRTIGARQVLSQAFITKLNDSWKIYGAAAINAVAEENPARYLELVAKLLPRQIHAEVKVEGQIEHIDISETQTMVTKALEQHDASSTKVH